MKARRKDSGRWVDVYYYGCTIDDGDIYKEFGSETEYLKKDLVFEDDEKIESYWFNFRNQAAMAAMQGMLANPEVWDNSNNIPSTIATMAVNYAYFLEKELKKNQ